MTKQNSTSSRKTSFPNSSLLDANQAGSLRRSRVIRKKAGRFGRLRKHWLALAITAVLSIGVIAVRVNSLGEDTKGQAVTSAQATPPKLAKEYIYAGPRMLAIEDAGSDSSTRDEGATERLSKSLWQNEAGSRQVSRASAISDDSLTP